MQADLGGCDRSESFQLIQEYGRLTGSLGRNVRIRPFLLVH